LTGLRDLPAEESLPVLELRGELALDRPNVKTSGLRGALEGVQLPLNLDAFGLSRPERLDQRRQLTPAVMAAVSRSESR
jgi:hypothetical protein